MSSYRSSGGVGHRRKTRLATTPYDPPPEKNRSWLSGTAGAMASGARRALAGVLPSKFSSADEDPGSASCLAKDGVDANDGAKDGVDANGVKALNKSERKLLLKQLIEQETFSGVESYELALLVDSKVADKPIELEERPATFHGKVTADVEALDHNTGVKAKEKYIEKKKETLVAKIYEETCDFNPSGTEHVLQLCLFLKDSKVGQIDVGSFTVKLPCHTSSKPEELHSDSHGLPAKELAEICRTPGVSGLLPSQTRLSKNRSLSLLPVMKGHHTIYLITSIPTNETGSTSQFVCPRPC